MANRLWRLIGFGNLLKNDDGFGPRFIEYMKHQGVPPGVELLDVGTSVPDLLAFLSFDGSMVIIDAVADGGGEPGQIYLEKLDDKILKPGTNLNDKDNSRIYKMLTGSLDMHSQELLALLQQARAIYDRTFPRNLWLLGVEIKSLEVGLELSECIERKLPLAREKVLNLVLRR